MQNWAVADVVTVWCAIEFVVSEFAEGFVVDVLVVFGRFRFGVERLGGKGVLRLGFTFAQA
jgi:hypothetical protein